MFFLYIYISQLLVLLKLFYHHQTHIEVMTVICLSPFETLHDDFCGDSIHVIGITSETRISLWWLHYFCGLMTKGHLFGAHVSVISLLRVKWRSGSVDCSS